MRFLIACCAACVWLICTGQNLEQFTQFYYNTFDQNRTDLAALYVCQNRMRFLENILKKIFEQREQSMLTFETTALQGVSAIIEKLKVV